MKELYFGEWKLFNRRWSVAIDLIPGLGFGLSIVRHPPEMGFEPYVTPWTETIGMVGPIVGTLTTWRCSYEARQADC